MADAQRHHALQSEGAVRHCWGQGFSKRLWRIAWRLAAGKPEENSVVSATGWDPSTDFIEYDSIKEVDGEFEELLGGAPGDKPPETHKSSKQVITSGEWPTLPQPEAALPHADDLR